MKRTTVAGCIAAVVLLVVLAAYVQVDQGAYAAKTARASFPVPKRAKLPLSRLVPTHTRKH